MNERGSIPIVLAVVLVVGIIILSLTQLSLSERIETKKLAQTEVSTFYNDAVVLEFVKNLTLQTINDKEWDDELENEYFVSSEDLMKIEDILNTKLLPSEDSKKQVSLTNLKTEKVENNCETMYEVEDSSDTEVEFIGFSCVGSPSDIEFDVIISEDGNSKNFHMILHEILPSVTRMGDSVTLDLSNMKVEITN